jgi:hypothetical protein
VTGKKYSPAIIHCYREIDNADGFDREIVARVAGDPDDDEVTFACGHKWQPHASLLDRVIRARKARCFDCREEWLEKALAEEKPEMKKPKYFPEIIRRYREMENTHGSAAGSRSGTGGSDQR